MVQEYAFEPNHFTSAHLMKTEWFLFADVTPVRSPVRAECDILGVNLDIFWPIQAVFVAGEPLCDAENPLLSPNKFT